MLRIILISILSSVLFFLLILISIAFLTLIERKFIASTQNRKGPNKVGYFGILQPFADALKLILKESIFPRNSRFKIFIISPLISIFFAILAWAFIPLSYRVILCDTNLGMFFIFTTSILHIYGVILAGWSSGSRYSFLGALRSTAQLVAYDISIGLIFCAIALFTNSLNLINIISFQDLYGYLLFYFPALFILFLVSSLAETNRHPFDLPEAESELVGGYNTEYSASHFALFFLGEYCSILLMTFLINHLFLGGWTFFSDSNFLSNIFYCFKLLLIYYFFLIIRAAIPRYRYDQLMRLGWKFILPISLSLFIFNLLIILIQDNLYITDYMANSESAAEKIRLFAYNHFYGILPVILDLALPLELTHIEINKQAKMRIFEACLFAEDAPKNIFRVFLRYYWCIMEGTLGVDEYYFFKKAIENHNKFNSSSENYIPNIERSKDNPIRIIQELKASGKKFLIFPDFIFEDAKRHVLRGRRLQAQEAYFYSLDKKTRNALFPDFFSVFTRNKSSKLLNYITNKQIFEKIMRTHLNKNYPYLAGHEIYMYTDNNLKLIKIENPTNYSEDFEKYNN